MISISSGQDKKITILSQEKISQDDHKILPTKISRDLKSIPVGGVGPGGGDKIHPQKFRVSKLVQKQLEIKLPHHTLNK